MHLIWCLMKWMPCPCHALSCHLMRLISRFIFACCFYFIFQYFIFTFPFNFFFRPLSWHVFFISNFIRIICTFSRLLLFPISQERGGSSWKPWILCRNRKQNENREVDRKKWRKKTDQKENEGEKQKQKRKKNVIK